jgi:hypothetical protein
MKRRKPMKKKAWEQPIVFRPSERDAKMITCLTEWLDDKPARVIRRAVEQLYETEKSRAESQLTSIAWFEKMANYPLTVDQAKELYAWEAENLDGRTGRTSDWPGWEPLIGTLPMGRKPKGRVEQGASATPSEPQVQSSPAVPPMSRGIAKTIAQPGSIAWMRLKRKRF